MNEHYEKMIDQVKKRLEEFNIKCDCINGCFIARSDSEHGFLGSIIVDTTEEMVILMEMLPSAVGEEMKSELSFAVNAVNAVLPFGKYFITPLADEENENALSYHIVYAINGLVYDGEFTAGTLDFIVRNSLQEIMEYGTKLLALMNGKTTASEIVNEIGEY
ncbi:MAG: hypothetical protein IKM44_01445 [Clostridia bacterium]|nr:hypothetical protein [Clostridia bacterium]